ncbi:MAG: coenzyme F420-0:L-glutamate ligase [Pseudomonadota bacterium]
MTEGHATVSAVCQRVELFGLPGVPEVAEGDDIAALAVLALAAAGLQPLVRDILVVTQKIVSKAEGRLRSLADTAVDERAHELAGEVRKDPRLVALILSETAQVLRTRPDTLIVEDRRGLVLANAGIDASNVPGADAGEQVLLLPEDPDHSAAAIRGGIARATGVELGVVLIDSIGRAWRNGTVGTAIGASGMPALMDLRGQPDRHGRPLLTTQVGFADEVAAAASLVMGQAGEGIPMVLVRGLQWPDASGSAADLQRNRAMDLFR